MWQRRHSAAEVDDHKMRLVAEKEKSDFARFRTFKQRLSTGVFDFLPRLNALNPRTIFPSGQHVDLSLKILATVDVREKGTSTVPYQISIKF
ncbi:hypothetical protein ABEB36_015412 [Hypothenemus hampei]|uniref:Uncharacterized protein n=1 Tax=Hypothenemus hampei TaxID=57062 RepID=A0ABD1E120_HYPHA